MNSISKITSAYQITVSESVSVSSSNEKSSLKVNGQSSITGPAVLNEVNTGNVFSAVDNFFNLGNPDRIDSYFNLSEKDKKEFLQIVAKLLKQGYMGYEILEIDGQPEKHSIESQIGDERTYGAKIYNKDGEYDYL